MEWVDILTMKSQSSEWELRFIGNSLYKYINKIFQQ